MKTKCITIIGEGEPANWGKHILTDYGFTFCGMPTVDVDVKQFAILKNKNLKDFRFEYKEEEWDVTCKKCLKILEEFNRMRKNIN